MELHQGIISCPYTEGLVLFCNEQKQSIFLSQNYFFEAWQWQTPDGKKYSIGLPRFSSVKCVDPLNAAIIFNVPAFLHGICK